MTDIRPLLLDTHVAIWATEDQTLAPKAVDAINTAHRAGAAILVSAITAWEIGLLVSLNRLSLTANLERWFQRLLETPGVRLTGLSPEVLIASSFLPGKPPRDPADRILLATARELGATLVTRDRAILAYGESGQVNTLAC
jgi:PIN domain nuclease of toxin-antitoxin system